MKIFQSKWLVGSEWSPALKSDPAVNLVFLFGSTAHLKERRELSKIRDSYPNAVFFGCSTAGEIFGTQVLDESLTVTAIQFKKTVLRTVYGRIEEPGKSLEVGRDLARQLEKKDLTHVFVLSDGLHVNGSDLVKGLVEQLPQGVAVTGGLSGDAARFQETLIFGKDGLPERDGVALLGMYGNSLKISYASLGGWDPFGPERAITRSESNVLFELDGKSALSLYKQYLGEHANGLPATGLLFPLSLRFPEGESGVVRTILAVDEKDQSITFAGTMPKGAVVRFMKANFDRLIDGASGAAKASHSSASSSNPDLAVLISCVGRKLILKQRVEEEVEAVREVLGPKTAFTGFYSYGEISPFTPGAKCELHNQTMTITTFTEI